MEECRWIGTAVQRVGHREGVHRSPSTSHASRSSARAPQVPSLPLPTTGCTHLQWGPRWRHPRCPCRPLHRWTWGLLPPGVGLLRWLLGAAGCAAGSRAVEGRSRARFPGVRGASQGQGQVCSPCRGAASQGRCRGGAGCRGAAPVSGSVSGAGQGRAGQGRAGQGRAGQGRGSDGGQAEDLPAGLRGPSAGARAGQKEGQCCGASWPLSKMHGGDHCGPRAQCCRQVGGTSKGEGPPLPPHPPTPTHPTPPPTCRISGSSGRICARRYLLSRQKR